jgi:thiamine kinase-like enzyme
MSSPRDFALARESLESELESAAAAAASSSSSSSESTLLSQQPQQQQQQQQQEQDGSCSCLVVCDRPYLPRLAVNPDDTDSVRAGAAAVLLCLLRRRSRRSCRGGGAAPCSGGAATTIGDEEGAPVVRAAAFGFDGGGFDGGGSIPTTRPDEGILSEALLARISREWAVEPVGGGVTNRLFRVVVRSAAVAVVAAAAEEEEEEGGAVAAAAPVAADAAATASSVDELLLLQPSSCLLVRVFGAEGMIDRDVDTYQLARLARQGLAPPYYGRLQNARVEGWCDNTRPLRVRELNVPAFRRGIAAEMARLHGLFRVDTENEDDEDEDEGGEGTTSTQKEEEEEEEDEEEVVLWTQLDEWCQSAVSAAGAKKMDDKQDDDDDGDGIDGDDPLPIEKIPAELQWIRTWIMTEDGGSAGGRSLEVAFCHNDVLAANVLVDDGDKGYDDDDDGSTMGGQSRRRRRIQLIDFEYGGRNYVAFDIANHWNEYAGGPPHTSHPNYEWFPAEADQRDFVQAYLHARRGAERLLDKKKTTSKAHARSTGHDEEEDIVHEDGNDIVDDDAVTQLLRDVQAFVLVNHLYWGLWAVNQARTEGCQEYDYATYARRRFEQYVALKNEQQQQQQQQQQPNEEPEAGGGGVVGIGD